MKNNIKSFNKMKKFIITSKNKINLISFLVVYFLALSCTDVSLSYNRIISDNNILGIWKGEDGTIYHLSKQNGTVRASLTIYTFNSELNSYQQGTSSDNIYFTSKTKNGYNYNFISIEYNKNIFITFAFKITKSKELIFWEINTDISKPADELFQLETKEFKTVSNFNLYVDKNLGNSNLFGNKKVLSYQGEDNIYTLNQTLKNLGSQVRSNNRINNKEIAIQNNFQKSISNLETITPNQLKNEIVTNNRDLNQILYYSYYDVYYSQRNHINNINCLKKYDGELIKSGQDKYEDVPVYRDYVDSDGNTRQWLAGSYKEKVESAQTYYSNASLKNVCPTNVVLKGIKKDKTESGNIIYKDVSMVLFPNESMDINSEFPILKDCNPSELKIGDYIYYENYLPIDKNVYNNYLNNIIYKNKGTIYIDSEITRTRIFLNSGDRIKIKAFGNIRLGMFAGITNPNGLNGDDFDSYSTTSKAPHGSLIYKFNLDSDWIFLGTEKMITANKSGQLRLSVNDQKIDDNSGYFLIDYEIIRAK